MGKNSTHSPQVDVVISYIRNLLDSGELKPGDRLPAERRMAELLGVSRANVRTAFQKLEFYGIVRTYPQSGTVVAQQTVQMLEGLIADMLQIDSYDFHSLAYVRVLLEVEAIRLCAEKRTDNDIAAIKYALEECDRYFDTDQQVEKDFAFHQAIARGAHNPVIASLLLIITPDVLAYYRKYNVCRTPKSIVSAEHHEMLAAIINKDTATGEKVLRHHLAGIMAFSNQLSSDVVE
ncbi:MAG: FadR/GntR family transcriptional regulator [Candidatus Cryptobacteroides sp.]